MNKQQIAAQIEAKLTPYINGEFACPMHLNKYSMQKAFSVALNIVNDWALERSTRERMFTKRDMDAIDKDRKNWQKQYNELAERFWWKSVSEDGNPKNDGFYIVYMDGDICGIEDNFVTTCGFYGGKWDEGRVYCWMDLPSPPKVGYDAP